MLRVHQQRGEFIAVQFQPIEHAQAHVVDAALHGAVHGLGVISVVVLRAHGMQRFIALFVVRFLEKDVRADARVLEPFIILHRRGRDVHVYAANRAVLVVNGIDGLDALRMYSSGLLTGSSPDSMARRLWPISCKATTSRTISSCVSFLRGM